MDRRVARNGGARRRGEVTYGFRIMEGVLVPTFTYGKQTARDRVEQFGGNLIVYLHWERHLMFCSAFAVPLPPQATFRTIVDEVIPALFGRHPDFARISWQDAAWTLDGNGMTPKRDASLVENGIGHKSVLRFRTPGLDGVAGSAS
jgi:phenol hydroxylase P4 protein